MKKRLLSILMTACLLMGLLPATALAADAHFNAKEGTAGANESEGYAALVDGNINTKWCVTDFTGAYVIFQASEAMKVTGYSITTGNDNVANPGRNPESWTLYGCTDYDEVQKTGTWVQIDKVTNDTVLKDEDKTTYNYYLTEAAPAYQYFKLEITATKGAGVMQMSEFTLTSCVHNWVTPKTTDPTCTTKGYTTYTCGKCGAAKIADEILPLGHDFSEEGGACTRCGKTKDALYTFDVSQGRVIIADDEYPGKLLVYYFTSENGFQKAEGYIDPSETITVTGSTNVNELHVTATTQVKIKAKDLSIDRSREGYAYAMSLDTDGADVTLILEGANSFAGGSGIAGIAVGVGKTMTIEGDGSLTATGIGGAGIGSSTNEVCGTITINGGTVTALSELGAGIGAGGGGSGGDITISGGTVTARSGHGAGIGGGDIYIGGSSGSSGSFSTGANGSAVIFASSIGDQSGKTSNAWSGIIFEGSSGKVYGNQTLTADLTIPADAILTIPESATLTIPEGKTLTNNGTIYVDGTLTQNGTVSGTDAVYYLLTVVGGTADSTCPYDGKTYCAAGSEITLTFDSSLPQDVTQWAASVDGVSVTGNKFTMPNAVLTVAAAFGITYELNGGTINAGHVAAYPPGQSVTLPTNVTKNGYTFAGWYDNASCTGDPVTEIGTTDTGNKTFWAKWTKNSSGGSSTPTYATTVTQPENGTVTMTPKSAAKGTTVTITVTPDKGYTLETLTVTDRSGNEIELTNKGDGKYTFKMPGSKVTVMATFMEDNSMLNFFVDVPADAYYYDAVLWAAENGITGGVDETHFAPDAACTRAQIVTFLWRAAGSPEPERMSSFADVPADSYYAKAVAWAVEQGITTGTGDGTTFSPNATCTRAQAMTFIYRSEQAQGSGMHGAWMFQNPFSDVDLESYYGEAVMWAVANGVTDGTTDTTFSPGTDCTRAQIVTFLFRCLGE